MFQIVSSEFVTLLRHTSWVLQAGNRRQNWSPLEIFSAFANSHYPCQPRFDSCSFRVMAKSWKRMVRHAAALAAVLLANFPTSPQAKPIARLSLNPRYIDATTGEEYVGISAIQPLRVLLPGPGIFAIDVRLNSPAHPTTSRRAVLRLLAWGSTAATLEIPERPIDEHGSWRGNATVQPGAAVRFYLDASAVETPCEFRLDGGGLGVAVRIVPTDTTVPGRIYLRRAAKTAAVAVDPLSWIATIDVGSGTWEESHTFGQTKVDAFSLGIRKRVGSSFGAEVGSDARTGMQAVRFVDDAPGDPLIASRAKVYAATAAATWTGIVADSRAVEADVLVGVGCRLEAREDPLVPHTVGLLGPRLGLLLRYDPGIVVGGLDYALPVHDSTPAAVAAGPVRGRMGASIGIGWRIEPRTALSVTYRSERLFREYSERRVDLVTVGLVLGY